MALDLAAVGSAVVLIAVSGCSASSMQHSADPIESKRREGSHSGALIPAGPLPERCQLGQVSADVQVVPLSVILADGNAYYGQMVRVRGYLIVAMENTSLVEPTRREESVVLDVRGLPATDPQQLTACRLKLVDVEGYVTHVPTRGGERLAIVARSMIAPNSGRQKSNVAAPQ